MIEPRMLKEKEAAEYLSLPLSDIKKLRIGRIPLGTRVRFDKRALDAHLDALSGLAAPSAALAPSAEDDSPDAAFDRFAQRHSDAPRRS